MRVQTGTTIKLVLTRSIAAFAKTSLHIFLIVSVTTSFSQIHRRVMPCLPVRAMLAVAEVPLRSMSEGCRERLDACSYLNFFSTGILLHMAILHKLLQRETFDYPKKIRSTKQAFILLYK
jgi:hypothetical protein